MHYTLVQPHDESTLSFYFIKSRAPKNRACRAINPIGNRMGPKLLEPKLNGCRHGCSQGLWPHHFGPMAKTDFTALIIQLSLKKRPDLNNKVIGFFWCLHGLRNYRLIFNNNCLTIHIVIITLYIKLENLDNTTCLQCI
jgi:hypothetical protein